MKLNKTMGRVATTLVATAMLASVAVVPTFAEGDAQFSGTTDPATKNYTVTMTKNLTMDENLYQPTETFTFDVDPYIHGEEETHEVIEGIPVSDGVPGGVEVGNAVFTTGTTVQTSANVTITVKKDSFSKAGIYKYTLSENTGANANVDYDNSTKYLYVYVKNDDTNTDVVIYGVVVKDYTTSEGVVTVGEKSSTFENVYGEVDGDPVLHNVTLTKTLSGDGANLQQEFPFTISITNTTSDNQVFKIWNDADKDTMMDEGEVSTIVANGEGATYQLGKDETVKIFGLRDGDTYSISEGNMSGKNDNKTADGYTVKINNEEDADGVITATLAEDDSDDISVTYDNGRTSVSPTGIVMNVAPYALLVVVAAAGCFVFMRKRRED